MKSLPRLMRRPIVVISIFGAALIAGCAQTATGDPIRSNTEPATTQSESTQSSGQQPSPGPTSLPEGDPAPQPSTNDGSTAATAAPEGTSPVDPAESAPPSTAPVYQSELVLRRGGIGAMDFGADPDEVMTYVGSLFGSTTDDSGWVEPSEFPDCPGTTVRVVGWGVLSLQFSDASPYGTGTRHFSGWVYGAIDEIGAPPEGMVTELGLTTGSSVADLKDRYPDVTFSEGDPNGAYPDSFFVDDDLWGLLNGPGDDNVVTVLYGGAGCGR